ncbi:hypothetical protein [Mycolicibacterium sp. CBMA 226]|uniref:hypothetical protein n=1 Tax=Mycolicibacterium sp. CBMA 226 TaxID=2606611 RepID=UPI0012DBF849|nr:hypothetical protein [Mycolicibacterium sp. CBMA 226]MUL75060.1 hypothetical protein [Mycolicibacterium sp. CBMA 226]
MGSRQHHVACLFEPLAGLLNEVSGLIDRVLRVNDSRFGAVYLSRSFICGFTRFAVRTKNASGRSGRKTTSLALPISQVHSLVGVMRNHITVEAIAKRHKSHSNIVERVLVDVWKCSTHYRLWSIIAWVVSLNCHLIPPFERRES